MSFINPGGNGVRILSLDGGDTRCLSQLLILQELMHRLEHDHGRPVRPCEYFHTITGVGASGVVAILLGVLGMTVESAMKTFAAICEEVFPLEGCSEASRSERLVRAIKRALDGLELPHGIRMEGDIDFGAGCHVSVCYSSASINVCRMFRNYKSRQFSYNPTIIESVRATWATPGLFSSTRIGPPSNQEELISAVNGFNNPALEAAREARDIFGGGRMVSTFLSLGSGPRGPVSISSDHFLEESVQQTENAEEGIERLLGTSDIYFRFSPQHTIQGDRLANGKQVEAITSYTRAYVERERISRSLDDFLKLSTHTSNINLKFEDTAHPMNNTRVSQLHASNSQVSNYHFSYNGDPLLADLRVPGLQYTLERIQHALMYQHRPQSANPNVPKDSASISQILDQPIANIHDEVAASCLNSGAKEMATLPSAIPSVPPLHTRTPAGGVGRFTSSSSSTTRPYTSPRFKPQSPRGGAGNFRSVRPVSRILGMKRESVSLQGPAPITTAYLAGLRRHVPLSIAHNGLNSATVGSASSSTLALPSDSPSSRMGSRSPKNELGMYLPNSTGYGHGQGDGGSLLLMNHRQKRPHSATGTTPSQQQVLQALQTSINGPDSPWSATRATAARKRADEDILQYSFRSDEDWRRRIVLEAVLSSTFVAENTLEPSSSGGNGGFGTDDSLMTGVGDALAMGLGAPGKSVYAVFLEQVGKSEWKCLFGDKEHPCPSQAVAFRRLERALDHVRYHLDHRPFGCRGECQKGDSCNARFFARSHLQDHVKRTESACCEICGQVIRIQNMLRHRMAH